MKEILILAYDLKHQVDLLPIFQKMENKVDGVATDMNIQQRAAALCKELERYVNEKER
tara:strand:- start:477 stop:650 length:174 start_codon:yes stop_codon:yes gene_type:complete